MYNKILVPLDGSELSECALGHVTQIAKGCRVPEVDLLYVVEEVGKVVSPTYIPSVQSENIAEDAKNRAQSFARDYLDKTAKRLKEDGIAANPVIMEGPVADKIFEFAEKNGVDLIIMSTHGRSGISRWAFGSVADRVVRYSRVPVLIVSPKGCRVE